MKSCTYLGYAKWQVKLISWQMEENFLLLEKIAVLLADCEGITGNTFARTYPKLVINFLSYPHILTSYQWSCNISIHIEICLPTISSFSHFSFQSDIKIMIFFVSVVIVSVKKKKKSSQCIFSAYFDLSLHPVLLLKNPIKKIFHSLLPAYFILRLHSPLFFWCCSYIYIFFMQLDVTKLKIISLVILPSLVLLQNTVISQAYITQPLYCHLSYFLVFVLIGPSAEFLMPLSSLITKPPRHKCLTIILKATILGLQCTLTILRTCNSSYDPHTIAERCCGLCCSVHQSTTS